MPDTVSNVVSRVNQDLNVRTDIREAGGANVEHVAPEVDVNAKPAQRAAEPQLANDHSQPQAQPSPPQQSVGNGNAAGTTTQRHEPDVWMSPGSMTMAALGRPQAAVGMPSPSSEQDDQVRQQGGYDSGYVSAASVDSVPASKRNDAYTPEQRSKLYQNLLQEADERADAGQAMTSDEPFNPNAVGPYHGTDTMTSLMERRKRIQSRYHEVQGPVQQALRQAARPESEWNSEYGNEPGRSAPRTREAPTKRNRNLYRRVKNWMKNSFGTRGVGVRIYAKLIGLPSLGLRDVGVGIQEIMEVIDRDPSMVERLFAPFMTDEMNNVSAWSEQEVADFVNSHEIYVATYKAPNNRGQDIQRRRLVVLTNEQRGVYINPIMAAMYTADFDGDDIQVSLEPEMAKNARDPMSYMVGADDQISLDMAFLPVARIVADPSTGDSPADYVRKVMLAEYADVHGSAKDTLVDAIVALSETYNLGDKYQKIAYAKVFRVARRFADWLMASTGGARYATSSDRVMERVCSVVYQGMRNIKIEDALSTFGLDIDVEALPKPRTYGDRAIIKLAEGLMAGAVPNNFQELKVMLTGFVGNVEKKNAPFRFSADVGKMMKMDPRLQVGDGEFGTIDENGDFKVDPNSDEQMELLFKSTVKYAESYHMAKEVKRAGRVEYYSQRMRDRVIGEVGFFDDVINVMGVPTRRYTSYRKYLQDFCDSYNRHSAVINQANLVFLSNMGIALNESNRTCVSPIKQVDGTYRLGDIAEPLLAIYGSYSVERMFSGLVKSGVMSTDKKDKYWLGNPDMKSTGSPHVIERESNTGVGDFWVTGKYMSYNLRAFAHENRLVQPIVRDIKTVRETTLASLVDRNGQQVRSDERIMYDVLMAIADKGTGAASKFNKSVYGILDSKEEGNAPTDLKTSVQMIGELASDLKALLDSPTRDQMQWIDDVVSALVESGPDMFYYFGMDSAAGFLSSRWGKALVDAAGNEEILGGIRTAMVFEWRMRYVTDIERNLPNPDANTNFAVSEFVDEINKLKFARDELADSSEVWRGILREFAEEELSGHKSVFQMMRESTKKVLTQRSNDISYEWKVEYDANDYWRSMPEGATLRSVIEDIAIDRKTKWSIIADVVRYWEQDAYLKSYEVGYQLEIGNDAAYSLGTAEKQSALKAHNDFSSAFTRWGKLSRQRMVENISKASDHYKQSDGVLTRTLSRLDECPWELVSIDDGMYADSLMSVKDKTYAQTEKASQHPWTNAIYSALMFQRNGGYMNDITRTDDRLLGMVNVNQVDIHDVIHILSDPDASMWVYNNYGEYGEVTRDMILSSALGRAISKESVTEGDIWEFLESEPRIASAIRRHSACINTNSKGDGYLGASVSTEETMTLATETGVNPIDNVKYLMRNHPVYAGIISLASKSPRNIHGDRVGAVPRNERSRVMRIEEHLCRLIYRSASESDDYNMAAQEILASLGITPQSVMTALKSDYDAYLDAVGLPKVAMSTSRFELNEAESDARFTYNVACQNLAAYISEVHGNVPLGRTVPPYVGNLTMAELMATDGSTENLLDLGGIEVGVDIVSIASFWDVIQELGGSKTNVSTGIEGAETYNWGVWASHMTTRDKYADLECVSDDVDNTWDGAWTNVDLGSGPATLEVDNDGNAYIMVSSDDGPHMYDMDHLNDLKEAAGIDDIVVMVPDGYTVRDRSTDSYGNPLTSLFMYMVSKRSNGAEAFNLKAKKAGYDGSDSITKMDGKYRTVKVKDDDGKVVTQRVSFFDIREELRNVAKRSGLETAKLELAKMLKKENESFGYDDMTLSNYMCLADLMLIQGDDDNVYLRSLEMIFSAIKYRIGEQVDDMTTDQLNEAIDSIVGDRSESGVGMSMMASQEAFNAIKPQSAASSMSGAKLSSSIWERNYDLLDSIASKHQGNVYPQNVVSERDSMVRKVACVKSVLGRVDMTRGYDVVGYVGPQDDGITVSDVLDTVGPSSMVVIGDGGNVTAKMVRDVCERAYVLGASIVVSRDHLDLIPVHLRADAIICSQAGDALIPMFDIRLNGSEAQPYNGGQFSIFQVPYSRYVVSVEDSLNVHDLGDAQYRPTKSLIDRLKLRDSGSVKIRATDLFPNVFGNARFRNCSFKVTQATREDIENYIAPGVRCTIDYGIVQGSREFDQRRKDVDKAIQRYRESYWNTDDVNDDGLVTGECRSGDIAGWMKLEIIDNYTHKSQYVMSPVIPFPLHGTKRNSPSRYKMVQMVKMNDDGTFLSFDWQNTSSIANSFVKYFDSSGGANKGMMNFADAIDDELVLLDGTRVDAYCAKQSTDSRKIGTDRRVKTMISLMAIARMHGYNFAAADGAFPQDSDHPENESIGERMLHERIPIAEWSGWLADRDMLFSSDRRLNAFLNFECKKILANGGNPWDYLANKYTDTNGNERNTHVMWEFEAMFEQGVNYENDLLRFLHAMDPKLCPNGIGDSGQEYLFRLYRNPDGSLAEGYDTGVLQMRVPHRRNDSTVTYVWDNVYVGMSFFGEDFSGFSRPNIEGASTLLDANNTMAYYGAELDDSMEHERMMWATSDIGRIPRDGGAFGLPDNMSSQQEDDESQ